MLLNHFYTTFSIDMSYSLSTDETFQQLTLIDMSKNRSNINQYVSFDFNLSRFFRSLFIIQKKNSFCIRMIIGLKSYCRSTFYGKKCSIQCIPNEDCTSSYTCNPLTGEKICSPGWYGNECSMRNTSSTCLSSSKMTIIVTV